MSSKWWALGSVLEGRGGLDLWGLGAPAQTLPWPSPFLCQFGPRLEGRGDIPQVRWDLPQRSAGHSTFLCWLLAIALRYMFRLALISRWNLFGRLPLAKTQGGQGKRTSWLIETRLEATRLCECFRRTIACQCVCLVNYDALFGLAKNMKRLFGPLEYFSLPTPTYVSNIGTFHFPMCLIWVEMTFCDINSLGAYPIQGHYQSLCRMQTRYKTELVIVKWPFGIF